MQRLCPECETRYEEEIERCPSDGAFTVLVDEVLADRLIGQRLDGRWLIEEALGEGGMGAVFRGTQANLDRPVAIKVLRAEVSGSDKVVARFMREARVLSRLRNPHIVTIFDFGRDPESGLLYLVMELLDGEPLGDWWQSDPARSVGDALDAIEQIARALDEAHAQQIIHRDLKPDNILITPVAGGFHATVLDFGIAKVHDEKVAITHTGDIHGTPYYMAPEQIDGSEVVPATDLYALGCILYEFFSGKPPFDADSVMAILMHHCAKPPEDLATRWNISSPADPNVIALVHDLIAKDPDDRPRDTSALLARIARARGASQAPAEDKSLPDAPSREPALAMGDTLDAPSLEGASRSMARTLEKPAPQPAPPEPLPEPSPRDAPSPTPTATSEERGSILPSIAALAVILTCTVGIGALTMSALEKDLQRDAPPAKEERPEQVKPEAVKVDPASANVSATTPETNTPTQTSPAAVDDARETSATPDDEERAASTTPEAPKKKKKATKAKKEENTIEVEVPKTDVDRELERIMGGVR